MKLRDMGEQMPVSLEAQAGGEMNGEAIGERNRAGCSNILTAQRWYISRGMISTKRTGPLHPLNSKFPPILAKPHLPTEKLQRCMTNRKELLCFAEQGQLAGKELPSRVVFLNLQGWQQDKGFGLGPVIAGFENLLLIKRRNALQGMAEGTVKGTAFIWGQPEGCFRPQTKQIF